MRPLTFPELPRLRLPDLRGPDIRLPAWRLPKLDLPMDLGSPLLWLVLALLLVLLGRAGRLDPVLAWFRRKPAAAPANEPVVGDLAAEVARRARAEAEAELARDLASQYVAALKGRFVAPFVEDAAPTQGQTTAATPKKPSPRSRSSAKGA